MKMNVSLTHQKEYDMYKRASTCSTGAEDRPTSHACNATAKRKAHPAADLPHMRTGSRCRRSSGLGLHTAARTPPWRTMQWRLYDCFWQMRLPELSYTSDASIALTTYLIIKVTGRDQGARIKR